MILTTRYGLPIEGGAIPGAPNIPELENINALLNTLHDNLISFHNAMSHTQDLITDPTAITFHDSRSLHDALCQILASIVNISGGLAGALEVLNNLDYDSTTVEIMELIESLEDHQSDFENIVDSLRRMIAFIEFNSNCSFFLRNNHLFGYL